MVLFTKYNMDADEPVPEINFPPVGFIVGPTRHGRTGRTQVSWDTERLVVMITTVGVLVEEYLDDIGMKTRKLVIHMECDGRSY